MTRFINRRSLLIQPTQREFYPFPNDHFHRININDNSIYGAIANKAKSTKLR